MIRNNKEKNKVMNNYIYICIYKYMSFCLDKHVIHSATEDNGSWSSYFACCEEKKYSLSR